MSSHDRDGLAFGGFEGDDSGTDRDSLASGGFESDRDEAAIDRIVQRRLATDRLYRNAESADAQAAREQQITDEEVAKADRRREETR